MKKQAKKTAREKQIEKIFKGSEVMVLIEDFNNKVGIISEGQQAIREDLKEFKVEMYSFRDEMYSFRDEMYSFRDEMYSFKDEMYSFKDEMLAFKQDTKSNFQSVFDYLSRFEDEIGFIKIELAERKEKEKIDKKWMVAIEKRLADLEKIVQKQKLITR